MPTDSRPEKMRAVVDPLIVDISPWSRVKPTAWADLERVGAPWSGAVVKASEGRLCYSSWLEPHWRSLAGTGLLRGTYHFAIVDGRGREQADVYLDALERAGGWTERDLWPVVDVEEGSGNAERVTRLRPSIVEDTVAGFAARVRERTGRATMLYAGWWLASLGLRSRMGCEWLWFASYTRTLSTTAYAAIGWAPAQLALWQYDGSGVANGVLPGYPTRAPIEHGEDVDISVVTIPGGLGRLRALPWAERPG